MFLTISEFALALSRNAIKQRQSIGKFDTVLFEVRNNHKVWQIIATSGDYNINLHIPECAKKDTTFLLARAIVDVATTVMSRTRHNATFVNNKIKQ